MIVAGFGFRARVTAQSLSDALARTGYSCEIACVATLANKAAEPGFADFATGFDASLCAVDRDTLARQSTPTQSKASLTAYGTGSVAEAAALAAAGPGAKLLAPRVVSADGMATCAVAEGGGG